MHYGLNHALKKRDLDHDVKKEEAEDCVVEDTDHGEYKVHNIECVEVVQLDGDQEYPQTIHQILLREHSIIVVEAEFVLLLLLILLFLILHSVCMIELMHLRGKGESERALQIREPISL